MCSYAFNKSECQLYKILDCVSQHFCSNSPCLLISVLLDAGQYVYNKVSMFPCWLLVHHVPCVRSFPGVPRGSLQCFGLGLD